MSYASDSSHSWTRVQTIETGRPQYAHAGEVYALVETCSHLGGPLSQGTLEDGNVRCPWHNSCFSLKDGHVINGPAVFAQPGFETRVRDGQIEVRGK